MDKLKFTIGFWHPFGDHGPEDRDQIILRKHKEIIKNKGWTLWSFQNRVDETIDKWKNELKNVTTKIFVLCSDSADAEAPVGNQFYAKEYKFVNSNEWINIPSTITIPHPFGKRNTASAFKVNAIYKPETIKVPEEIKWLCMDGRWREDNLPTRGEYLIKSGGKCKLRKVYQILELEYPYLAILRK
ncbi:MAG: hypothetical protein WBC21_04460 [Minisyncoccales bacterium]